MNLQNIVCKTLTFYRKLYTYV